MNLIRRLIELSWNLWAWFKIPRPTALTDGAVCPRVPAQVLIARAQEAGAADARSGQFDPWSFVGPDGRPDPDRVPHYVRGLRELSEAAVQQLRSAQEQAESRVGPLRRLRDEEAERARDALRLMGELANASHLLRTGLLPPVATQPDPLAEPDPGFAEPDPRDPAAQPAAQNDPAGPGTGTGAPDRPLERAPWEGETVVLGPGWRLLILTGLLATEIPVQYSVLRAVFADALSSSLTGWLSGASGLILVCGPFIAGSALRHRGATGSERRLGRLMPVLAAAWLVTAASLGQVRGALFQAARPQPVPAHLTSATIVAMFAALLALIGAMSFMLGLTRRHPFLEAYVRHRVRRHRLDAYLRHAASRLNPDYVEDPARLGAREAEIRAAYEAAATAYYEALCRTSGDPALFDMVRLLTHGERAAR